MRQFPEFPNFYQLDHPLIQHKLTEMRDRERSAFVFRSLLKEISMLIGYEISRGLEMTTKAIRTPMSEMVAPTLAGSVPCIVPVLRAGLGMAEDLLDLIPTAQVGHIGVYRDHETKRPVEYLVRLPKNGGQPFFVVDPMLATGHSLSYTCDVLINHGIKPESIRVMALVAAPEGLRVFFGKHPNINVYCAALDEKLDERAYIVPGLGDAGDRMYGTE